MMLVTAVDNEITLSLPIPAKDAGPLFELIDTSRTELSKWLSWVNQVQTPADEEAFLTQVVAHFDKQESLNTVIWYQNQRVGMISLNHFDRYNRMTDIGYWLGTQFVRRGIMTKAVKGICQIGFQDYQVDTIEIHAAVDNHRSNQVAERAGFQYDRPVTGMERLVDGLHDGNVWRLNRELWTQ